MRQNRGELLFARCWLLVEGETEVWVYSAAARALGFNLHREGVRLVALAQSDAGMLAKIASAFGIDWYCVGDDDDGRRKIESQLSSVPWSTSGGDRTVFPYPDIETHLLSNGYDAVYREHMPMQNLQKITTRPNDPGYWREYARQLPRWAKARAAAEVAIEMERRGESGVSPEIGAVVRAVVQLAQGGSR